MEYFQKKVPNTKNQNFEIFYQKIRQIEVRLQKCKQTFTNFLSYVLNGFLAKFL